MVWALAVTETISCGVLYYSFGAFLLPMKHSLGFSQTTLTCAFSAGVLVTGPTPPATRVADGRSQRRLPGVRAASRPRPALTRPPSPGFGRSSDLCASRTPRERHGFCAEPALASAAGHDADASA